MSQSNASRSLSNVLTLALLLLFISALCPEETPADPSCPVPDGTTCQNSRKFKFSDPTEIPVLIILCENHTITWQSISKPAKEFSITFGDSTTFGTASISSTKGKAKTSPATISSGSCVDVPFTFTPAASQSASIDPHVIVLGSNPMRKRHKKPMKPE